MAQSKRISRDLLTDELKQELDSKLDFATPVSWEQITNKPQLSDDSWKAPVNSPADLPLIGNVNGDIRLTLGAEKYVFTWDSALAQWILVGSNDTNIDWSAIQGKPLTYAPSAHSHVEADITNLDKYTKAEANTLLNAKANTAHVHNWSDITGKPTTFAPSTHSHTESDISNLDKFTKAEVNTLIGGRAPLVHTHAINDVTGLQGVLDTKVTSVAGKELSDNNYADSDKQKLDSLSDTASVEYSVMYDAHQDHVNDSVIHVTQTNKDTWNTVTNKADTATVNTQLSTKAENSALSGHTSNSTIHVTQQDKDLWNNGINVPHTHAISEVNNLQSSLDSKLPANIPTGGGITFDTAGLANGRFFTLAPVPNWVGWTLNASFSANGWMLDDTSLPGWFLKLDVRAGLQEYAVYKIPAGANPHTNEYPVFQVKASDDETYLRGFKALHLGNYLSVGATTPTTELWYKVVG